MTDIIYLLGLSTLSIAIAYHASLSHTIKDLLWLSDYKQRNFELLSKFCTWSSVAWWLTPMAVIFKIWRFIHDLINCQYCTATWLGFAWGLLSKVGLLYSIGYAGLCYLGVILIEKLMNYDR